ncbi:MAG: hypothetical protein AB9882_14295 [Ignavibacteriaceae bacterium]
MHVKYIIYILILLNSNFLFGQVITNFSEKIYISKDGSADVIWNFEFFNDSSENYLVLPWNFKAETLDMGKTKFTSMNGSANEISARLTNIHSNYFLRLSVDTLIKKHKYIVKFFIPAYYDFGKEEMGDYGNYSLKFTFANSSIPLIKDFTSSVILPEGYIIGSVVESIPKQKSEESIPPFKLFREKERNGISLSAEKLRIGENAFLNFKFKSGEKPYYFLFALIAIVVLYLVFFRDVLKNGNNGKSKEK